MTCGGKKDEEDFTVFEKKILRGIFWLVVQQDGTWPIRTYLELDDALIRRENTVKFIKSQRIR